MTFPHPQKCWQTHQHCACHPSSVGLSVSFSKESVCSTETSSSSSTVHGPGALSGKAVKALGNLTLRAVERVIIHRRLANIRSHSPSFDDHMCDDLLELSRPELYDKYISKSALRMLIMYIGVDESCASRVIARLLKFPDTEIRLILCELSVTVHISSLFVYYRHGRSTTSSLDYPQDLERLLLAYLNFLSQLSQISRPLLEISLDAASTILERFGQEYSALKDHPICIASERRCSGEPVHILTRSLSYPEMQRRRRAWRSLAYFSENALRLRMDEMIAILQTDPQAWDPEDWAIALYDVCADLVELTRPNFLNVRAEAFSYLIHIIGSDLSAWNTLADALVQASYDAQCDLFSRIICSLVRRRSRMDLYITTSFGTQTGTHHADPKGCILDFFTVAATRHLDLRASLFDSGVFAIILSLLADDIRQYPSQSPVLKVDPDVYFRFPTSSPRDICFLQSLRDIEARGVEVYLNENGLVDENRKRFWTRTFSSFRLSGTLTLPRTQQMEDYHSIEQPFAAATDMDDIQTERFPSQLQHHDGVDYQDTPPRETAFNLSNTVDYEQCYSHSSDHSTTAARDIDSIAGLVHQRPHLGLLHSIFGHLESPRSRHAAKEKVWQASRSRNTEELARLLREPAPFMFRELYEI